ncbi:MAG: oligosaccharide flippase family protein [Clostridia bacterium]|nr:oligosaccharide flippase family protein [Clostridia bacterium]
MDRKYKHLLKDTAIFAIGSLGSKAILFFMVPLYTNYLSTAEYGTADLVAVFSALIIPVVSLSIEKAVIRFGMKRDVSKEQVLLSAAFVSVCAIAATVCIMPLLGFYQAISEWRVYLAAHIILSVIAEIERAYLKMKDLNKAFSMIGICQTVVLALANVLLLTVFRMGVKGYLISNILSVLSSVILCFFVGRIYQDLRGVRINWALLRQMIRYAAPLILSGISWWILHASDKVMIEWLVGASVLGIYTAATKLPSLIHVIIGIFNQAWGLSSIRETETDNAQGYYASVFDRFSFVLFGAGIVFIALSKPFMRIYVGQAFQESWKYTPFLLFAAVFYALFSFMGSIYAALQRTVNDMRLSFLCACLNILINYFGIKQYGASGAVIGTAVSYFVTAAISIFDIRKYVRFEINLKRYAVHSVLLFMAAWSVTFSDFYVIISFICIGFFFLENRQTIQRLYAWAKTIRKAR